SASATTSICTRAPPIAKNLSRAGLAGQRRLCCCGHAGIVPPSAGRNALIGLRRTPVSWLVFEDRRAFFQHRIDDAPGLLDVIFPGEQGGVSLQRIPKEALVSVHLVPARLIECEEFEFRSRNFLTGNFYYHSQGDLHVRADAEAQVIRGRRRAGINRWRSAELDKHLRAGHRQLLAGPDVAGHPFPP